MHDRICKKRWANTESCDQLRLDTQKCVGIPSACFPLPQAHVLHPYPSTSNVIRSKHHNALLHPSQWLTVCMPSSPRPYGHIKLKLFFKERVVYCDVCVYILIWCMQNGTTIYIRFLPFFFNLCLKPESHVVQANFKFPMQLKMTLNLSSCLHLLSAEINSVHNYTLFSSSSSSSYFAVSI